jgi:hypothetical protein
MYQVYDLGIRYVDGTTLTLLSTVNCQLHRVINEEKHG